MVTPIEIDVILIVFLSLEHDVYKDETNIQLFVLTCLD